LYIFKHFYLKFLKLLNDVVFLGLFLMLRNKQWAGKLMECKKVKTPAEIFISTGIFDI